MGTDKIGHRFSRITRIFAYFFALSVRSVQFVSKFFSFYWKRQIYVVFTNNLNSATGPKREAEAVTLREQSSAS